MSELERLTAELAKMKAQRNAAITSMVALIEFVMSAYPAEFSGDEDDETEQTHSEVNV